MLNYSYECLASDFMAQRLRALPGDEQAVLLTLMRGVVEETVPRRATRPVTPKELYEMVLRLQLELGSNPPDVTAITEFYAGIRDKPWPVYRVQDVVVFPSTFSHRWRILPAKRSISASAWYYLLPDTGKPPVNTVHFFYCSVKSV